MLNWLFGPKQKNYTRAEVAAKVKASKPGLDPVTLNLIVTLLMTFFKGLLERFMKLDPSDPEALATVNMAFRQTRD